MYLRIKQVKILLKRGIPKCLFLTFLKPGSSTRCSIGPDMAQIVQVFVTAQPDYGYDLL